jgi:hypothetical protein
MLHSPPGTLNCSWINLRYNRSSLYQFRMDHTENTSHVIDTQPSNWAADCCLITSCNNRLLRQFQLLRVATCLPSCCLEMGCISPLFYSCVHVLLSNGCFCGATVLAWGKYATVYFPKFCCAFICYLLHMCWCVSTGKGHNFRALLKMH